MGKRMGLFICLACLVLGPEAGKSMANVMKDAPPGPEEKKGEKPFRPAIFDDQQLLDGFARSYADQSQETLLAIIKDETLSQYKTAAALKIFRENFLDDLVGREKKIVEKTLLRRLNRTASPFIQVEIMYTLVKMDRHKYFHIMVPRLIQKLDHYNATVNVNAFLAVDDILRSGNERPREARIVFRILRKMFFLSRKRLEKITEPDARLTYKLKLMRWAVKILGTEELKRLPQEVIHLL